MIKKASSNDGGGSVAFPEQNVEILVKYTNSTKNPQNPFEPPV